MRILDVFAYYFGDDQESEADPGMVLRFIERGEASVDDVMPLPGLVPVPAEFDATAQPAYADHWVSNVRSRVGFLRTLEDTLGFTPKVDFNAGVVAAGACTFSFLLPSMSGCARVPVMKRTKRQTRFFPPASVVMVAPGLQYWHGHCRRGSDRVHRDWKCVSARDLGPGRSSGGPRPNLLADQQRIELRRPRALVLRGAWARGPTYCQPGRTPA